MLTFTLGTLAFVVAAYLLLGITFGFVRPQVDEWVIGGAALVASALLFALPPSRRRFPTVAHVLLALAILGIVALTGFWLLVSQISIGK